jgi:hypothetical protein
MEQDMERNFWTFLTVCTAGGFALVLLAVWREPSLAGPDPAEPAVLRVHAVPDSRLDDIRGALSNSLSMGEGQMPLGRVSTTGQPGQLLVLAPESVQEDIKTAISALGGDATLADSGGRGGSAGPADITVELDLWSVDAIPGEGADDPSLAPISAALAAARKALGPVRFERRDALSISTHSGSFNARTAGGFLVSGTLRPGDGGVVADLMLQNPTMSTTLHLRFDEAMVLARIAGEEGRTRVLVARARPVDARD